MLQDSMKRKDSYLAIGLMSGTSLDGLDVALCSFTPKNNKWEYELVDAKTFSYSRQWREKLANAQSLSGEKLWQLHAAFGKLSANHVNEFLRGSKEKPVLVASHGHTVFHQPHNNFTTQIGDGASIAALTGIDTVCDFRSTDVALGGQGAPLVPIGDELLFYKYDACLNIGGIANISFNRNNKMQAFDICPANIVFNFYANQENKPYDKGGKIASSGKVNGSILKKLNTFSFYKKQGAKSLGREWIEEIFFPVLENSSLCTEDKMATAIEHSAFQIAAVLNKHKVKSVLATGGGAYNNFLIKRIKHHSEAEIVLPDDKIIQFKEALIFAFLGVLRVQGEINCLCEVTGAKKDSCAGSVYKAV